MADPVYRLGVRTELRCPDGAVYPWMQIIGNAVGDRVAFSSAVLKRIAAEGGRFSDAKPGELVEIREGGFAINPQCRCSPCHAEEWRVVEVLDFDEIPAVWIAERIT